MDWFLSIQIIAGPVPWILLGLSAVLLVALLARPLTRRWVVTASIAVIGAVAIAVGILLWANVGRAFGLPLPMEAFWWMLATFVAVALAIVSLWDSRWWRKIVAIVGMLVFAATGTVQINAVFGLDPTIGAMLGIVVPNPIELPPLTHPSDSGAPLYESWTPPSDLPAQGRIGTAVIAGTVSGFVARPAGIYLPPAALVKDPPALPVMIFMMGFPGSPDETRISSVMETFAAQHQGLAPIVVVADQLGTTGSDPACADSKVRGNAETYITKDVVNWVKAHLNVTDDPRYWTIGGYSNGATCAVKYGTLYSDQWKNVVAVSPEIYPGSSYSADVIQNVYGGDQAAWQAAKPTTLLAARKGKLGDVWAVVSTGAQDTAFGPESRKLEAAMAAAGMDVRLLVIPGVGHVGANLPSAQAEIYPLLFPRLGLAPAK